MKLPKCWNGKFNCRTNAVLLRLSMRWWNNMNNLRLDPVGSEEAQKIWIIRRISNVKN